MNRTANEMQKEVARLSYINKDAYSSRDAYEIDTVHPRWSRTRSDYARIVVLCNRRDTGRKEENKFDGAKSREIDSFAFCFSQLSVGKSIDGFLEFSMRKILRCVRVSTKTVAALNNVDN